jgi:pimeloyl-ACP methyl ester carboxylesterase
MQRYYRDQPSVTGYQYLALRAPNDTWNGFYDDYVPPLVVNLIRQFLLFGDVNPDKVYLMGYSHGGYGAFFIGPKTPDRFAAVHASAAAPTDGTISPITLRNTRFTCMVGEKDNAYGRRERCEKFNEAVKKLKEQNAGDYPVELELKAGFGHGGLPDRDKVKEMYPFTRNPVPRHLSWELTDPVLTHFYWLSVPQPGKGQFLDAVVADNAVRVTTRGVKQFELALDGRLIAWDKPLRVTVDGKEQTLTARPSFRTLCQTLAERGDPRLAFSWRVRLPAGAAAAAGVKDVREAVARALPLLRKAGAGHMEERTCFACHNQALPLLAMTTTRARGLDVPAEELEKHADFIATFLDENRANYLKGRGQGGAADTAGYALLALELAGRKPDATTAAVAEYLLQYNQALGHWRSTSNRPPSEVSPFTVTYLAVRGLQTFGTAAQEERIRGRLRAARAWLEKSPARDTEDRVFRLWALKRVGAGPDVVRDAARELLQAQRPGGGWAQLDTMEPDAYATGSALVALHEAGGLPATDAAYRRGVSFLLGSQRADGSWHVRSRSRPFQIYFESGFPHGKDQFISVAASGWATAALALALPPAKLEAKRAP